MPQCIGIRRRGALTERRYLTNCCPNPCVHFYKKFKNPSWPELQRQSRQTVQLTGNTDHVLWTWSMEDGDVKCKTRTAAEQGYYQISIWDLLRLHSEPLELSTFCTKCDLQGNDLGPPLPLLTDLIRRLRNSETVECVQKEKREINA